MSKRRPGLWMETALGLALVTLVAIVLSAGVVGLLFKIAESERRTDLAQATARGLRVQLEVEAQAPDPNFSRVLRPYAERVPDGGALWMVDANYQALVVLVGQPDPTQDAGSRAALYSKQEHLQAVGSRLGERHVHVTEPILRGNSVIGALRFTGRLDAQGPFGGQWMFFLSYVLLSTALIAGMGFWLFRGRLVRPILEIQEATHSIASGEFGQQVAVDGPRELMELSSALSTLSASLSSYRERSEEQLERLARANDDLREAQRALIDAEKLASVGRLAAGIAHEVGNPLAAVSGYVELLSQGVDEPDLAADMLARSRRELERIQHIIGDLLSYARPEELAFSAVEVEGLLNEAQARVRIMPQFQAIQVRVEVEETLPCLWIQREKVHQVLLNLLLNAADALGGRGVVRLQALLHEDGVLLKCVDSGPGFDPDVLEKIFEPFFTTKQPGEGTGLGLAISHRIVSSQGGRLSAVNAVGGGAELWVTLPVEAG